MFANASLARRIERAEVGLVLDGAQVSAGRVPPGQALIRELAGGAAVFIEPDSPFNKVVGLGFHDVPATDVLVELEQRFAERHAPVQFEVSTLGEPELLKTLTRRGYELSGFENVLGLAITASLVSQLLADAPVEVQVSRASVDESALWLDTLTTGFLNPDVFDGPATQQPFPREALERVFGDTLRVQTFERFLARRNGTIAGGAGLRLQDGVAQLNGAATLPDHRRRGVQSALLRHRLLEAANRGCDIAVVTTQPGSKSQENAQKSGFALLYARAVLVKEPSSR